MLDNDLIRLKTKMELTKDMKEKKKWDFT
jgi:hypothetical protein